MTSIVPWLSAGFLACAMAIPLMIPVALARGTPGTAAAQHSRAVAAGAVLLLAAWFCAAALVASEPREAYGAAVRISLAFGPVLLVAGGLIVSGTVRSVAHTVPVATLVRMQTVRVVGAAFIVWAARGEVPWIFALIAGLGDVLVGVTAPFAARAAASGGHRGRRIVGAHAALGLADFAVAIGTAILTKAVVPWPVVLIPAFLVPLAILLHLWTLYNLWRNA